MGSSAFNYGEVYASLNHHFLKGFTVSEVFFRKKFTVCDQIISKKEM